MHLPVGSNKATVYNHSEDLWTITALDISSDGKYVGACGKNKKAMFMDVKNLGKKLSLIECRLVSPSSEGIQQVDSLRSIRNQVFAIILLWRIFSDQHFENG